MMKKKEFIKKNKTKFIIFGIVLALIIGVVLNFNRILELGIKLTMGREFPQLQGEPKLDKWYAIDIDEAVSSDGSGW